MKKSLATVAVLAILVLAGCKNKEKELPGTWTATQSGKSISMTLKEDKTWSATIPTGAANIPVEGTWSFAGDNLNMKTTKFGKATVDQLRQVQAKLKSNPAMAAQAAMVDDILEDSNMTLSGDGKTLTEKPNKAGKTGAVFTKSGS